MKQKAANYSDEQVELMRNMYKGEDNTTELAQIAAELGKSIPSVRSKLSTLGIYRNKEKAATQSTKVRKEDLAAEIGEIVGMNDVEKEALTKTTSAVLNKLLARLQG